MTEVYEPERPTFEDEADHIEAMAALRCLRDTADNEEERKFWHECLVLQQFGTQQWHPWTRRWHGRFNGLQNAAANEAIESR